MVVNKTLSMLGLARRAGKLSMGHDMAQKAIFSKKARLLLCSSDASERAMKELETAVRKNLPDVPCIRLVYTMDEIHYACGYKAGVMTVDDENFAKKIVSLLCD